MLVVVVAVFCNLSVALFHFLTITDFLKAFVRI